MARKTAAGVDPLALIAELADIGSVDTVYRDLYLQRARTLMAGVISFDEFRRTEQEQAELATLPVVIGRALQGGDWPRVKELSSRSEALRRAVEGKKRPMETARAVYVVSDVRLDPFSPGLRPFTRRSGKELATLRAQTLERLTMLERTDAPWKEFYSGRRGAFATLALTVAEESATRVASMDPREAAQQALKGGDMGNLARLADMMMTSAASPASPAKERPVPKHEPTARSGAAPSDLLTSYSEETVTGARRLGLAPRRLEGRVEIAALRQYAWNPVFGDEPGQVKVKQVPLPAGTPEAFRDRLEMLMIHPLINSGGARHLPSLVDEDVLVEDFPDPKEGDEAPASDLLARLGLPGRRALPRIAVEQALLAHGSALLETELHLDPRAFRLVCIPPDVHIRLGEQERWGRQPFWTHFDGYIVMANGSLRALAGGDVRYGGLYNLVGIGRDYDSDRVMARFAVVRRERMVAW
jgi:hypothetical protein